MLRSFRVTNTSISQGQNANLSVRERSGQDVGTLTAQAVPGFPRLWQVPEVITLKGKKRLTLKGFKVSITRFLPFGTFQLFSGERLRWVSLCQQMGQGSSSM
jgi:hypothetical protein